MGHSRSPTVARRRIITTPPPTSSTTTTTPAPIRNGAVEDEASSPLDGGLHGAGQPGCRVAGARLRGRLHVDVVVDAVLLEPDAARVGLRHQAREPVAAHGLTDRGVRRHQVRRVAVQDLLHLLDLGLARRLVGRDVLLLVELVVLLVAVPRVRRAAALPAGHVAEHRVGVGLDVPAPLEGVEVALVDLVGQLARAVRRDLAT